MSVLSAFYVDNWLLNRYARCAEIFLVNQLLIRFKYHERDYK